MTELIEVGKSDDGADGNDQHEGRELLVLLRDLQLGGCDGFWAACGGRQHHDGVGDWLAIRSCDTHDEIAGPGLRAEAKSDDGR